MTTFPAVLQRAFALGLTAVSRAMFRRRTVSLPPRGRSEFLSAVIRLGPGVVPDIDAPGHYVYPPDTVHVTITNLDDATVDTNAAMAELGGSALVAPTFHVSGVGCSPDTMFIRCVHDRAFGELRERIWDAFGVERHLGPTRWIFDRISFANLVRFDARGEWLAADVPPAMVVGLEVEIVRTDRYLSEEATVVLARLPLRTSRRLT